MKKVCRIFVSIVAVFLLPSCVTNQTYGPKTKTEITGLQWQEKNGDAALPLPAARDFCSRQATDESAKIAAVSVLDKKLIAGSGMKPLDLDALDAVKASEMSKCMSGLGFRKNGL